MDEACSVAPCDKLLGAGGKLLAAGRDVLRRAERLADHAAQLVEHLLQRDAERVLVGQPFRLDRQIAGGDRVGELGGLVQIQGHGVERLDEIADLVVARRCDTLAEIADGDRLGEADGAPEAAADIERDPHR